MGFFSDMDESDFDEQEKEIKPIIMDPNASEDDMNESEEENIAGPMVSRVDLGEDEDEEDEPDIVSNIDYPADDEDEDFGEPLVVPASSVKNDKKEKTVNKEVIKEEKNTEAKPKAKVTNTSQTVIAKGTTISGGVVSEDDITIEGIIEGSVEAKNVLIQNGGQIKEGIIAKENLEIHGNIDGDITGKQIRLYQSKIHGNIISEGAIYVDKSSVLNGDVQGKDIEVYGRIRGEIFAEGKATLHRGCIVKGNVRCKDILLETGAKFQGAVEQTSAEDIDDSLFE